MKSVAVALLVLFCGSDALAQELARTPVKSEARTEILDFSYAFPAEAAAIPALKKRLEADLANVKLEARRYAREGKATARLEKRDFNGHYFHKEWVLLGQSGRLMSFIAQTDSFTGGAHGNSSFESLLWDRQSNRVIGPVDLFGSGEIMAQALRTRFCKALDEERRKRRGSEKLEGEFAECPPLTEVRIAPVDMNGDGRFDRARFFAAPYVAGPYAEGAYEVDVPVSREFVQQGLKPEFRSSFEAQPGSAQPQ